MAEHYILESVQRICFIDEEIHSGLGKTIRPTGDLGKFVNGNLYYCGRKSKSVKRNGQLVSLHLLSKVVELIENIDACFCSLSSRKELVLFIKPSATISRDFLESHIFNIIKTKLGSTYLPERVEFVDYFPITSHGKVDEPTLLQFLDNDRKFDSNPRHLLKYYWCSALNLLQPPGSGDRFVECGGDSFSAVYIINKIYAGTSYQQLFHVFMSGTYSEILSTLASLKDHTSVKFTPTHSQDMRKNEIKIAITKKEPHQHFLALLRKNEMQTCLCFPSNNKTATKITFPIKMVIAWKHSLKKCIDASPLVILDSNLSNGVVYIGSHAHLFTAVSCKTGKMLWETELGDRVESSAVVTGDGNLICVGCYDGNLYMMDRYDGTIDWIYKSGDAIKCSPAVDFTSCTVVFGSYDKHIYALDLLSKSCLWKVYFGSSCFASPLIHPENNCVYICLLSGSIFSLKLHTGDQLWQIQLDKPVFSSPSLCDTFLCVGCVDECLYAISLSGELLWKFQTNGSVFSSPVCIKIPSCTCIVFGSNDNSIYCITITGILLWKFNAEGGTCVRKLWRGHLSHALFKRHSYIWLRRRLV